MSVPPNAECIGVPMADGGEETVDAVIDPRRPTRLRQRCRCARPSHFGYLRLRSATTAGCDRDRCGPPEL